MRDRRGAFLAAVRTAERASSVGVPGGGLGLAGGAAAAAAAGRGDGSGGTAWLAEFAGRDLALVAPAGLAVEPWPTSASGGSAAQAQQLRRQQQPRVRLVLHELARAFMRGAAAVHGDLAALGVLLSRRRRLYLAARRGRPQLSAGQRDALDAEARAHLAECRAGVERLARLRGETRAQLRRCADEEEQEEEGRREGKRDGKHRRADTGKTEASPDGGRGAGSNKTAPERKKGAADDVAAAVDDDETGEPVLLQVQDGVIEHLRAELARVNGMLSDQRRAFAAQRERMPEEYYSLTALSAVTRHADASPGTASSGKAEVKDPRGTRDPDGDDDGAGVAAGPDDASSPPGSGKDEAEEQEEGAADALGLRRRRRRASPTGRDADGDDVADATMVVPRTLAHQPVHVARVLRAPVDDDLVETAMGSMPESEMQLLTQENEQLLPEFEHFAEAAARIEQQVAEVGDLLQMFSEKVAEQDQDIVSIHDAAVEATHNVDRAAEELIKATQRGVDMRIFVVLFMIVSALALLFAHALHA